MHNEKCTTKKRGVCRRRTASLPRRFRRRGFSLIEVLISITIAALLVTGVITVFNYALAVIMENKLRIGAITLVERQLELSRNLPYDSVGTVGGIPSGVLAQVQNTTLSDSAYTIETQVVFVDDPFDGTVGGTPNDPLGTDYKKVRIAARWTGRFGQKSFVAVTTVAPRGIESSSGGGTLSIQVFNANGQPVPQADLTVVNTTVTPPVNISGIQTDANGKYLLPGAPASLNSYRITATKTGYSTDKTCAIDQAGSACTTSEGNPNPTKPHATVLVGQLTDISFAIDQLSTLTVKTIRQPTPSEWVINTGGGAYDQDNPAMTICPNGNYLFVWRDLRQNNNPRIYAQQYDASRNPVWSPDLAITTSNNQNQPDVAVDGICNIYYAWQDDRNGNQDIYFDKYTAAGLDGWGGEKKVQVASQSADQTAPQVVVNASSTAEYVVWQDAGADAGDIFAQKYDPDGNPLWASEVRVNSDVGNATQSIPTVALDADENIIFLWHDNRNGHNDIFGQKFSRDGVRLWPSDRRMNGDTGSTEQLRPHVAVGADGAIYGVWEDSRNGNADIYAQRYDGDGAPQWASDVRVNSDTGAAAQGSPVIVVDAGGTLSIAWEDNRNGTYDVYLQRLDNSGTKLIEFDVRVNTQTTGDQGQPDLALNAAGKLVIVWQDNASGNFDIRAAIYDDTPQTVTPVGNVLFTLRGAKRIGENPVIPKFQQSYTTDGTGVVVISNIEWDNYTLTPTGYTLLRSEPAQPVLVSPNTAATIYLNLQ
ncbi:MAG: carboxypeptidase regulatory-like domain-containing protein [Patescibacteria group bacterium]|nr:carboxypeptidase regulatory-like domain-containing protein [Patescibacteria group bacterium]